MGETAGTVPASADPDGMGDDAALARRAAAGDRQAFAALISAHYGFIHRVAWRWCGGEEAEDVAQDVCVKLATALDRFDGRSRFSTWLYRVTLNVIRDRQRAAKRRQGRHDALAEVSPDRAEAEQDAATMRTEIWRAVRRLPTRQRDALLLVFGEQMTHAEAAAVLKVSETTVSWHIHRGKKALRGLL